MSLFLSAYEDNILVGGTSNTVREDPNGRKFTNDSSKRMTMENGSYKIICKKNISMRTLCRLLPTVSPVKPWKLNPTHHELIALP